MHRHLPYLTAIFVAVLLISGIVSTKLVQVGPFTFDGGTLLFPISYIFGDIFAEVYGYQTTKKIIRTGFACMLLMSLMIYIVGILPITPDWTAQIAYDQILMLTPRIFLGSIIAYICGSFANTYVMVWIKSRFPVSPLWMRTIGSTVVGQIIDTGLMILIAFWGVFDPQTLRIVIISNYIFKVFIEIIFTPITYIVISSLRPDSSTVPA